MNRIKEVIKNKGVKQVWLAEKLGKSFNMVNDYCNNRRQPSLELLFQIAKILNVQVSDLIKEESK
jgi:transcriptional regulator with XRE-family HTH domain